MLDNATLSQIVITTIGTFFGTTLVIFVTWMIRQLGEIKITKELSGHYRLTISGLQVFIGLTSAFLIVFTLGWIITHLNSTSLGVKVVCGNGAPSCTVDQRLEIYEVCTAKSELLAMEMFSEGLSSGGIRTQLAAASAADKAQRKHFKLCVMESGFVLEPCDKGEPDCL